MNTSTGTLFIDHQKGFTLVEMAMVLLIVGLLLGGLLPTISSQVDQRRTTETQALLTQIREALIGYAIINGRLPCPATSTSSGTESFLTASDNASTGKCSNPYNGYVPAATLGLSGTNSSGLLEDAWGNPIHYAVTKYNYIYTKSSGLSSTGISSLPTTTSYLLVCSSSTASGFNGTTPTCGSGTQLTSDPGVPAIIFSTGMNGAQGGSTSSDETQNLAGQRTFISHDPVKDGYDDIMVWISQNTLVNRMVSAGTLP